MKHLPAALRPAPDAPAATPRPPSRRHAGVLALAALLMLGGCAGLGETARRGQPVRRG